MKTMIAITTVALVVLGTVGVATAGEKPCAAARDLNNDGKIDQQVAYVYANGLLRTESIHTPGNPQPTQVTQFVYDRLGRLWGKAVDTDGDGAAERHFYFDYRSDGKLFAEGIDEGPDGWLDQITVYSHVDNVRIADVDFGADGTADRKDRLYSMYDYDGYLVRQVLDEGSNGSWDRVTSFSYDSSGRLIGELVDRGGDGSVDESITYRYQC